MEINVSNIYNELTNLNLLIENYEQNYLNMYKSLMDTFDYWKDENSNKFYLHLEREKNESKFIVEELISLRDIYSSLYSKYSKIGNKILFSEQNFSNVLLKIDDYINLENNILKKYYGLNLDLNDIKNNLLKSQMLLLEKNIQRSIEMRKNIEQIFNQIISIEKEIKSKISKINIEVIKESDINEFL